MEGVQLANYSLYAFGLSYVPDPNKLDNRAIFEFDAGYISIPREKFDKMKKDYLYKWFRNDPNSTENEIKCNWKCIILMPCNEAKERIER